MRFPTYYTDGKSAWGYHCFRSLYEIQRMCLWVYSDRWQRCFCSLYEIPVDKVYELSPSDFSVVVSVLFMRFWEKAREMFQRPRRFDLFPFSLWDSTMGRNNGRTKYLKVSVLFMRFNGFRYKITIDYEEDEFPFSLWDSMNGLNLNIYRQGDVFPFSLWDSGRE